MAALLSFTRALSSASSRRSFASSAAKAPARPVAQTASATTAATAAAPADSRAVVPHGTVPAGKVAPLESRAVYTDRLHFTGRDDAQVMPVYRVMEPSGRLVDESQDPKLPKEQVQRMYRAMVQLNTMDSILYEVQRQGLINFYMTSFGEEGTHIGCGAALDDGDTVYAQYRETGTLMWRGFSLDNIMSQCFGNDQDAGKGRQMPVHYGSKKHNWQTISSPLGTQIPQAAGAAYALKMLKKKQICVGFFGDGAASEGDFHAALNFAATLESPTMFFCRNNGFAISTPTTEQYRGDGIAGRGPGYGIATLRVDGNDIWAVYNAVRRGRAMCLEQNVPVLIEAMTYRIGHHSTSDDSSRYRSAAEVKFWQQHYAPIPRLRAYMELRQWWDDASERDLLTTSRADVLAALKRAETRKKPPISELFTDVYDVPPKHLEEQKAELERILATYPGEYPLGEYADKAWKEGDP